jgi:hypothetical protein
VNVKNDEGNMTDDVEIISGTRQQKLKEIIRTLRTSFSLLRFEAGRISHCMVSLNKHRHTKLCEVFHDLQINDRV